MGHAHLLMASLTGRSRMVLESVSAGLMQDAVAKREVSLSGSMGV